MIKIISCDKDGKEIKSVIKQKPKFGCGDKVRIVNYGTIGLYSKRAVTWEPVPIEGRKIIKQDELYYYLDIEPKLVGQERLISHYVNSQGPSKVYFKRCSRIYNRGK